MKRFLLFVFLLLGAFVHAQEAREPVIISDGRLNICQGTLFDTGGAAGNYEKNETITMTLCPDSPGGTIRLEFTSFLVGDGAVLRILDGAGNAGDIPGSPFSRQNPIPEGAILASSNQSGCLTLVWSTGDHPTAPGFSANIMCELEPCQTITPIVTRTIPEFAPGVNPVCEEDLGVIRVCAGEELQFFGDALFSDDGSNATYKWDLDNGVVIEGRNATFTFTEKGAYRVRFYVETSPRCKKFASFIVQVADPEAELILTSDKQVYCVGEPISLRSSITLNEVKYDPGVPESNPVALPDGPDPVTGAARIFISELNFKQFCASSQITRISDIKKVCFSIYHTYMGDLDIILAGPDGRQLALLKYGDLPSGNQGIDLGVPTAGTFYEYCITPDATETMRDVAAADFRINPLPEGDYAPARLPRNNNFEKLFEEPLNGIWQLRIEDKWGGDSGYLSGFRIEFDSIFDLPDLSFTPQVASQRWLPAQGLVEGSNGTATVIQHIPGEYTYTYEVIDDFGCVHREDITVVIKDKPILGEIKNLQSCIDPLGRAYFNLPDVNVSIGGNYEIKYFSTQANAYANHEPLADEYVFNESSGSLERTIWVRVKHAETDCFVVDSFKVIAKRCPIDLATLQNLYACRGLDGSIQNFDLTVQTPLVYFNNPNYTVSYYNTMENADAKENPIVTPENYPFGGTGNTETIYVRVENNANPAEYATTSFMLVVSERPVIETLPTMYACSIDDKDFGIFKLDLYTARIAAGETAEVRYYTSLEGARDDDQSTLIGNTAAYQSRTGVVGYRVTNLRTGCFNYGVINLEVVDLPELNEDLVLTSCSSSTTANGIGSFNLNAAIPEILNFSVDARLEVSFYRTLDNANNEVNALDLSRNFVNDVPYNQTIFARVAYTNGTCAKVIEVELLVHPKVVINEYVTVEVCAENLNREMIVDLTVNETQILNGLNPSEYQITYYTNRNDATIKVRPISNPEHYSSTVTRSVWVRVESIATGCFNLSNLVLVPIQAPIIETLPIYSVCETTADSGLGTFNLSDYLNRFLNGRQGLTVSFHASLDHATNNVNPINATSYNNTEAYEQVIYVRFVGENGCAVIRPLTLKVMATPTLNIPDEAIGICSIYNDGIATFDLLALVEDLQNGDPSMTIKFYEIEEDAYLDINSIPYPRTYTNMNAGGATIYVRGELGGGCFVVKPLVLEVISSPVIPIEIPDLVLCSNDVLEDFAHFDLTVQTSVIVNAQTDPNNTAQTLEVKYFLSEDDAKANTNAIVNPTNYVNILDTQVIWYRVFNKRSSCFAVGNFKIIVNKPLGLRRPNEIVLCQGSLPNTGKMIFDLTIRETEILGRDIDRVSFKYYESEYDAKQDRNAIADPSSYENLGNPQTIWVAVKSFNGCMSYISLVIRVAPLPNVVTPRPIYKCVQFVNANSAEFDLTVRELEIANQSPGYVYQYFETEEGAITVDLNEEILYPRRYPSSTRTVYVRVTRDLGDECFVVVPIQLVVNPLPEFDDITFVHCLVDSTGFSTFDLTEKMDEILNGRNPEDTDIYFYVLKVDALGDNVGAALPPPYTYTNFDKTEQEIWVRVVDKNSGCAYVGPITLKVEEKVFATDIDLTDKSRIEKCATPTGPSGTARFDLNVFTTEIKGIQAIPDAELGVTYYYNNAAIDPAQLGRFELPIGTHEITAVVKRIDTADDSYLCTAEVTFTLTVEESPIAPVLQGSILCVDYNTGKLIDPYTIDSGYRGEDYEFQWEYADATGAFIAIPGATNPYYVVENISLGRSFRVVVKYSGQQCATASSPVTLTFVDQIDIKVQGADSKGLIGELDGDEKITVTIASPMESSIYEYALDEGAYQDSRFFYDVANGSHRVWVRFKDAKSVCPQYIDIFVLGYPKFFTPNGDGFNDTWNISSLKGHPEAVIYIYDRFGKLLKQLSPSKEGWDGTFNGKPMPSTDYWFTVDYLEEAKETNRVPRKVQFKGHFSLKR
ncbi:MULTISPECIES: T9SS type B sorting domain-containing protein [unclassified Myroides]|uniref:T9SS type B sorting domain-containing protein n=1 Tax=unclassified Myroides TaxID=2642485 RepID=UPI003D2F6EBB